MDYNFQAKFCYNENYVAWKYWSYPALNFFFFTAQIKCYTNEKYFQSSLALLIRSLFRRDYHVTDILILCKIVAQKVKENSTRRQTTGTSYSDQKEQRVLLVLLWFAPRNKKHINSFDLENVCFTTPTTNEAQTVSDRRNELERRYARMRERRTKFAFGLRCTVEQTCTKRIIIARDKYTYMPCLRVSVDSKSTDS